MQMFPTLSVTRRHGMHFVKLSDTQGINLDGILAWYDFPAGERHGDTYIDHLLLLTIAGSVSADGLPQPHEIHLAGAERLTMLHWLNQVNVDDDWKRAYEDERHENQLVSRRLWIYQKHVSEEQHKRIWDEIDAQEKQALERAIATGE